jgi:hypothetical protein
MNPKVGESLFRRGLPDLLQDLIHLKERLPHRLGYRDVCLLKESLAQLKVPFPEEVLCNNLEKFRQSAGINSMRTSSRFQKLREE